MERRNLTDLPEPARERGAKEQEEGSTLPAKEERVLHTCGSESAGTGIDLEPILLPQCEYKGG